MSQQYNLSTIAYKLSSANGNRFVTEDAVYQWVRSGALKATRAPYNRSGCGKYHLLVEEADLVGFLRSKGYDVDSVFTGT